MIPFIYCTVITALAIDYLKEGLDTPPLGVLELRSEYEIGYIYLKQFTVTKLLKIVG